MKKGFTLTELLVVIAIIGILSVIVFPYYQSARKQLALQRSANKLAQDVRRAQGMALGAEECKGTNCPTDIYGYGIFFDTNSPSLGNKKYRIYADNNLQGQKGDYDLDQDGIVEDPGLEGGIIIFSMSQQPQLSINFKPPDPEINIQPGGGNTATVTVCIEGTACNNPANIKTITVNKAGLIYVE